VCIGLYMYVGYIHVKPDTHYPFERVVCIGLKSDCVRIDDVRVLVTDKLTINLEHDELRCLMFYYVQSVLEIIHRQCASFALIVGSLTLGHLTLNVVDCTHINMHCY